MYTHIRHYQNPKATSKSTNACQDMQILSRLPYLLVEQRNCYPAIPERYDLSKLAFLVFELYVCAAALRDYFRKLTWHFEFQKTAKV